MKEKWYKTAEAKQLFIGLAILLCWSIITGIYSYIKNIDWLKGMSIFWDTINLNVGLGWLIIVLMVYTAISKIYFRRVLRRDYMTKKEVLDRLSEKVNCSCCDSSWDVLFAQITPYHPMHSFYTADEYYLNRFRNMIWFGIRKKPSPDYYDIEHGIDGLIEVIKHKQYISDTERDEILDTLSECDETKIKSKKEKLLELINKYHK